MIRQAHNRAPLDMTGFAERYARDRQAVRALAKENRVSIVTVYNRMDEFGIRRRTGGDATRGTQAREQNPNWKDGTTLRKDGYILEYLDGKQHFQHRLVMERYLGRPLDRHEVVHHANGNQSNNRIENLELLPTQSAHNKLHMTSERARAMQILSVKARAALKARDAA